MLSRDEEEALFSSDLAVRLFPGKWSTAKQMARKLSTDSRGVPYWMRARQFYLELGGEYLSQQCGCHA
jgi:hypothetical protein